GAESNDQLLAGVDARRPVLPPESAVARAAERHRETRTRRLLGPLIPEIAARPQERRPRGGGGHSRGVRTGGCRSRLSEVVAPGVTLQGGIALRRRLEARVRIGRAAAGTCFCLRIYRGFAANRARQ